MPSKHSGIYPLKFITYMSILEKKKKKLWKEAKEAVTQLFQFLLIYILFPAFCAKFCSPL